MSAYYNECDPYAAQWLRNLITAGHIAPGEVDERSIKDVRPDDLKGFTQCHFFAGVGVWSHALRLAGWADDRPVWTGSCPCQPFSTAGAGGGVDDERHLWPDWFRLIEQCRPDTIFGEQVEAAIKHGWLDLVQSDMEGIGYAVGSVGLPAAGVGAPHIRQRLWFVADAAGEQKHEEQQRPATDERGRSADMPGGRGMAGGVDNTDDARLEGLGGGHQAQSGRFCETGSATAPGESGGLGDTEHNGSHWHEGLRGDGAPCAGGREEKPEFPEQSSGAGSAVDDRRIYGCESQSEREAVCSSGVRPSQTNGHWRDADWLLCRDGKWRPVEPGAFPLAHGAAARVGRLRAYGNAIVPQVAAQIIAAYMDMEHGKR